MQTVTSVDPKWLAELGPMFFSIKESDYTRSVFQGAYTQKNKTTTKKKKKKTTEKEKYLKMVN